MGRRGRGGGARAGGRLLQGRVRAAAAVRQAGWAGGARASRRTRACGGGAGAEDGHGAGSWTTERERAGLGAGPAAVP